jgi:hypothetical protein
MILPPGGFLMIGLLLVGKNWWALRTAQPKAERIAAMAAARAAAARPAQARTREGALV